MSKNRRQGPPPLPCKAPTNLEEEGASLDSTISAIGLSLQALPAAAAKSQSQKKEWPKCTAFVWLAVMAV